MNKKVIRKVNYKLIREGAVNLNNKINNIIKKNIVKFIDDKSKLEKFIRKTKKINFINLYFLYLSITHKYKIKSSL